MAQKVTIMVLEVDLQCPCCYKKVKKLLCKFPEIRDQVYDEKQNRVTITVVCCSPERIRDKLCCKGKKVIKSIEIKPPPKPKEPEKPKLPDKPKEPEKPKAPPEKPKLPEKPKEPEKPKAPEKPKEPEKPKAPEKPKEPEKPKIPEKPAPTPVPVPVPAAPAPKAPAPAPMPQPHPVPAMPVMPAGYGTPSIFPVPFDTCCGSCYEGRPGGPCYQGYGRPEPPYYNDNYGYNNNYGYGGRPCYVSRCDYYISDDNTSGCTIM